MLTGLWSDYLSADYLYFARALCFHCRGAEQGSVCGFRSTLPSLQSQAVCEALLDLVTHKWVQSRHSRSPALPRNEAFKGSQSVTHTGKRHKKFCSPKSSLGRGQPAREQTEAWRLMQTTTPTSWETHANEAHPWWPGGSTEVSTLHQPEGRTWRRRKLWGNR
jgi:hypothetical protein